MNIKIYKSNIEVSFSDDRESFTLQSDNYFNSQEPITVSEEREFLSETFALSEEEVEEIIQVLLTNEWIEEDCIE